jgi:hypothetical protein
VHLALEPTPIHIGRWRPEPSQNLRHLAARKARPGRRAALGLIHRHRHNHHPFAAACAYDGSLRWPPEPTVSSKRARCARCSSRARTTKLSRRSCRRRARQRAAAPRGDRYVVRPAAAWSCPRRPRRASWWRRSCGVGRAASGAWDGCARGCSVSAERASRSISSRYEPTSPRYANCPEPTETPGNEYRHPLGSGCPGALSAGPVHQPLGGAP